MKVAGLDNRKLLWATAFAVTVLLSLVPFFRIGFTSADDLQYFVTARQSWKHWMLDAEIYAHGQGRFYFLITKFFYYVPYLIDNFYWTKAVQYVMLVACWLMFAYLVYRIFSSRHLAVLTFLLLVFDLAVMGNSTHVATINYPFFFTFSFLVFMVGVLLYINYYERGGLWRVWVAVLLFFVTYLFYENYLLMAVAMGIYIPVRHWCRDGFKGMWRGKGLWKELFPLVGSLVVYVAIYEGYRRWLVATVPDASFYDGAQFTLGNFNVQNFWRIVGRCTTAALPGSPFAHHNDLVFSNSLFLGGHRNNILFILTHAPAAVYVNALIQALLLWFLARNRWCDRLKWRGIITGFVVAVALSFFVHFLIAATPKYNLEWASWMSAYVTTFYSYFGVMLALALIIVATLKLCRKEPLRRLVLGTWCIVLFCLAVLTGYSNDHLSREWAKSQNRFNMLDRVARQGFFDTLPDNAILYTEELHNTSYVAYNISKGDDDLENYIRMRAGRYLQATASFDELCALSGKNPDSPVYYFHAVETKKAGELLMAVALLDSLPTTDSAAFTASHADVFYLSPTKEYTLIYRAADGLCALDCSFNRRERVTHTVIDARAIDPSSFIISNMRIGSPTRD